MEINFWLRIKPLEIDIEYIEILCCRSTLSAVKWSRAYLIVTTLVVHHSILVDDLVAEFFSLAHFEIFARLVLLLYRPRL